MRRALFVMFYLLSAGSLQALEVRFHPKDFVYSYEVEPAKGISSVMLQNVAFVQAGGEPVTLESAEIRAMAGGQAVQTVTLPAQRLEQSARQMSALEAQGVLKAYDFYFQTSRYLGEGVRMASGRTLEPGTALVVFGRPLLLDGPAEVVEVVAHGRSAAGPVEARGSLKVVTHEPGTEYHLPVTGTWYVAVAPSFHTPHRWVTNEEFAVDLVVLEGEGRTHKGDGSRFENYYAYGRDVLAIGEGVVVEAVADGTEDPSRLPRPGESYADFEQRTLAGQSALLAKGYKAPLGNAVVIRHAGGEHSHYAHLKPGSIRVKAGDMVKRGQVIGQVGHSGNSTEPHLHFQVTDGPDPMYSRGVPVVFRNAFAEGLGYEGRALQSGWVVTTRK